MKNIYKIIIALIVLVPTVAFGARGVIKAAELNFGAIAPTGINQGSGFISPLRIGDRIEASSFIASSTSASSIFYGLVGVGTSSPVVPLDVLSTTGQALSVTGGVAGVNIAQFSRRAGAVADIIINASGGDPQFVFSRNNVSEFSMGDDGGVFKIAGSNTLGFSDILSATANGNVGIGTTSPYAKLSVEGQIVSSFFTATSTTATSTAVNLVTSNKLFVATTTDNMWNGRHPVLNVQGATTIAGNLIVGSAAPSYADDNLSVADFVVNLPTYSFLGLQNLNTGTTASIDLVFANHKTTATDYYADCGISGGNNADPVFTGIGGASAYYCFNTDGSFSSAIGTTTKDSVFNWVVSADGGNTYLTSDIKMQLTNGGNLGIGTTSARFPLQVASTTAPQLTLTANGITDSNWSFRNAGGNMYITGSNPVTFATSTNPAISLSPALSQVSIGTSTFAAGAGLTVAGNSNPVSILMDSISATGMYTIYRNSNIDMGYIGSAGILFTGTGGAKTEFAIRGSSAVTMGVGSGEDMRIASTGFVGIATTTPYKPLSVVGAGGVVAESYFATSTTATSIFAGSVAIGTTTTTQKLQVDGGIRLNTATSKPTCDSTVRGTFWAVQSGVGVKDTVEVCAKDAGDAYAWRTLY